LNGIIGLWVGIVSDPKSCTGHMFVEVVMKDHRKVTKEQVAGEVKAEATEAKAAKKVGRKAQVSPPPPPMLELDGVANPLVAMKGMKRALLVAICLQCKRADGTLDEEKARLLVRASGICYKAGYSKDNPTDTLTQNEWSGRPYVKFFTNDVEGKVYADKHGDKLEKVIPFAQKLVSTVAAPEAVVA
jgi:hypothetical protein